MDTNKRGGSTQSHKQAAETTKREHGEDFFKKIGSEGGHTAQEKGTAHKFSEAEREKGAHLGGQAVSEKYGPEHFKEMGEKGGRS